MLANRMQAAASGRYTYVELSSNRSNYNLRSDLISNYNWDGNSRIRVLCTITAPVLIGSASTASTSFTVGTFPAGSFVWITNYGRIYGRGGAGGSSSGGTGGNGGHAFAATVPVYVDNRGIIAGGGGGGGGGGDGSHEGPGENCENDTGGAGGTGAGSQNNGSRGSGQTGENSDQLPNAGAGNGGDGGTLGSSGASGQNGASDCLGASGNGGSPGSGGNYATGFSNITWVNTGTRLGGASG